MNTYLEITIPAPTSSRMAILRSHLHPLRTGTGLLQELPGVLRRTMELDEARRILAARFQRPQARFLRLIREIVYADPQNPNRRPLDHVGCEAGDLEQLVERERIEGALAFLLEKGVYLSVEEFKGQTAVKRGSLYVQPAQLAATKSYLRTASGGSEQRRDRGSKGSTNS